MTADSLLEMGLGAGFPFIIERILCLHSRAADYQRIISGSPAETLSQLLLHRASVGNSRNGKRHRLLEKLVLLVCKRDDISAPSADRRTGPRRNKAFQIPFLPPPDSIRILIVLRVYPISTASLLAVTPTIMASFINLTLRALQVSICCVAFAHTRT